MIKDEQQKELDPPYTLLQLATKSDIEERSKKLVDYELNEVDPIFKRNNDRMTILHDLIL